MAQTAGTQKVDGDFREALERVEAAERAYRSAESNLICARQHYYRVRSEWERGGSFSKLFMQA